MGSEIVDHRRHQIERVRSMEVQGHYITGFVGIDGAGEVGVDVQFPVLFREVPSFSFGMELLPGNHPEEANYPVISACVHRWYTREAEPEGVYYTGARVGVVTWGRATMRARAHLNFFGRAMRNPITSGELGAL